MKYITIIFIYCIFNSCRYENCICNCKPLSQDDTTGYSIKIVKNERFSDYRIEYKLCDTCQWSKLREYLSYGYLVCNYSKSLTLAECKAKTLCSKSKIKEYNDKLNKDFLNDAPIQSKLIYPKQ